MTRDDIRRLAKANQAQPFVTGQTGSYSGKDEKRKTAGIPSGQILCNRSGKNYRPKEALGIPGTALWTPALKPISKIEALSRSGYYIEGLSVEEYLFECIKIAREVYKREWKMIILPLGSKEYFNIIDTWKHVYNRMRAQSWTGGGNTVDISVKHRTLTINRHLYYENGQTPEGG